MVIHPHIPLFADRKGRAARLMGVLLILAFIVTLSYPTFGQEWMFRFDPAGNWILEGIAVPTLPRILSQPQPLVIAPGLTASFSVVVENPGPLRFQWKFEGHELPEQTNDALVLPQVTGTEQGTYTVEVSNASGTVTSAPAPLWIDSDNDGLPDQWEMEQFGSLDRTPLGDADGDGSTNIEEWMYGTLPLNPSSKAYRLFTESDGGSITVTPSKTAYLAGETVTLTASSHPGELFHGWTGDVVNQASQVQLVMDSEKSVEAHFKSVDLVWTNTVAGNWNNPTNWSPNLVPTREDNVTVAKNVSITVSDSQECGDLEWSAGTLTGAGTLTVRSTATWSSGNMLGTGRTVVESGAEWTFRNTGIISLTSRTLVNRGTLAWAGAGGVSLFNGSITNESEGLMLIQNNTTFQNNGGANRIDNSGTLRKTSTGTTSLIGNVAFNHAGQLDLEAGTLLLGGGGLLSGSMELASGGLLAFSGGTFTSTPSLSITGPGNLSCLGATVTLAGKVFPVGTHTVSAGNFAVIGEYSCTNGNLVIAGGTANFSAAGTIAPRTLTLSGGTLTGSQPVFIPQQLFWSGGNMNGSATTLIQSGATGFINNPVTLGMNGRKLENGGTIAWTGSASISVINAVITNQANGLILVQNNSNLQNNGGANRVDNAGTLLKSSTGISRFTGNVAFNNYNLCEIQAGALALAGGGINYGRIQVAGPGTLQLSGGTFNSLNGSFIEGAGGLTCDGAIAVLAGNTDIRGPHLISAGSLTATGLYSCTEANLTVSGGTATFSATGIIAPPQLKFSGGILGGTQTIRIPSQMSWSGGTMSGNAQTVIQTNATCQIGGAGGVSLISRTLINQGTISWSSGGGLTLQNATLTNQPGALFWIQNNTALQSSGGINRFNNAGTLRKSTSGTTGFSGGVELNNYSNVDVQAGLLVLSGGGICTGTVEVGPSATLTLAGGTFTSTPNSKLHGDGKLTVSGGTVTLAGEVDLRGDHSIITGTLNVTGNYNCTQGRLTVSGGALNLNGTGTLAPTVISLSGGILGGSQLVQVPKLMNWTGGTLAGPGRTLIQPAATCLVNNAGTVGLSSHTLVNQGTLQWSGNGAFSFSNGQITNQPGALFLIQNNATIQSGGGINRIDNAGTLRKTSPGTSQLSTGVMLANFGLMELNSGTLALNGGFEMYPAALLSILCKGTIPGTDYGRIQSPASTLTGTLRIEFSQSYSPQTNDTFTVLTATKKNGTFSSFQYQTQRGNLILSNTPTAVIVRVTETIPQILLSVLFHPPTVELQWNAQSNVVYRLEYGTDLHSASWTTVATAITARSNTASYVDTLTPSNRFYRVLTDF